MRSEADVKGIHIGVKYCGGCKPLFDRAERLRQVKEACPGVLFDYFEPGVKYDKILVINGCPAVCADTSEMDPGTEKIITGPDDDAEATARLIAG